MRAVRSIWLTGLLMLCATVAGAETQTNASPTIAVFPVELWDTSGEGAKPDQSEKLAHATAILSATLEKTGRFRPIDLALFKEAIAKTEPRYNCNGCWRGIATEAGADFAALATIHKVSSLISSFDISIANMATGKLAAYASGQFRGDDDQSYTRSIAFLVKERLFNTDAGPVAPQ